MSKLKSCTELESIPRMKQKDINSYPSEGFDPFSHPIFTKSPEELLSLEYIPLWYIFLLKIKIPKQWNLSSLIAESTLIMKIMKIIIKLSENNKVWQVD